MIEMEYNDAQVSAALQGLFDQLAGTVPVMERIGLHLVDSTEDRFAAQVSPEGQPWAPRSKTTIENYERRKLRYGGILHLSGQLGSNIHSEAGPDFVIVGSPEPYAAVMQFGAAQGAFGAFIGKDKLGRDHFHHLPWGDIPARPFLGVSDQDKTDILDIVHEALARALGGG